MAKALLLKALHEVLADYVLGLSPENLKIGVWSGKIVLDDLQVSQVVHCKVRDVPFENYRWGIISAGALEARTSCCRKIATFTGVNQDLLSFPQKYMPTL